MLASGTNIAASNRPNIRKRLTRRLELDKKKIPRRKRASAYALQSAWAIRINEIEILCLEDACRQALGCDAPTCTLAIPRSCGSNGLCRVSGIIPENLFIRAHVHCFLSRPGRQNQTGRLKKSAIQFRDVAGINLIVGHGVDLSQAFFRDSRQTTPFPSSSPVGPVCAGWRHDQRAVRSKHLRPRQFAQGADSMESLRTIPSCAVGGCPARGRD